jgi:hypothetical protein
MDVRLTPAGLPSAPAGVSSSMLGAWAQGESSCPGEMPGRCVRTSSTKIKETRILHPMRIGLLRWRLLTWSNGNSWPCHLAASSLMRATPPCAPPGHQRSVGHQMIDSRIRCVASDDRFGPPVRSWEKDTRSRGTDPLHRRGRRQEERAQCVISHLTVEADASFQVNAAGYWLEASARRAALGETD